MAHFAQLDDDNIVINVVVVNNGDTSDIFGLETEAIGVGYLKSIYGGNTKWKQTSLHDNFRKSFASIGCSYYEDLDAFIGSRPYASWELDTSTLDWTSPLGVAPGLTTAQVSAGTTYYWDESAYQADNTTGWIEDTDTAS